MSDAFLDAVSHELRTPLTAIRGFVELVGEGDVGPVTESQREFLEIVARNAERLEGLIRDLLELRRIESPGFELALRPVELGCVLSEVIGALRREAQEKGLVFCEDLAPLPEVTGDRDRLTQLFRALVSSALQHTASGEVGVQARAGEGRVVVTVFGSGDDSPSALGLGIARAIVERHHGAIRVESERGSSIRFVVTLPAA
jgi:signal transduction histidine kinase